MFGVDVAHFSHKMETQPSEVVKPNRFSEKSLKWDRVERSKASSQDDIDGEMAKQAIYIRFLNHTPSG